jgi:large subunit ribosomal protein L10
MKDKKNSKTRASPVPEYKKKSVAALAEKMRKSKTVLIASTKGLPSSQFQKIKKDLRGKAEISVAKKSIISRAITETEKGTLQNLKNQLQSDIALIFSDMDAFELSALLVESQSATKAKAGDIAPEDVHVEPGPTELIPGPAISELGSVGLKVAVENGKLAIKIAATIVKKGEPINDKVAGVMGKLNILPMKVGFIPLAAYDSKDDKIYVGIKIDKKAALEELRTSIAKALGFAVNLKYLAKETLSFFISKAVIEEKALARIVEQKGSTPGEQTNA